MFATQYSVTPSKRPIMRLPERASAFMRDVKRRSLRVKRSKSLVINPPEKRKSGKLNEIYLYSSTKRFLLRKTGRRLYSTSP